MIVCIWEVKFHSECISIRNTERTESKHQAETPQSFSGVSVIQGYSIVFNGKIIGSNGQAQADTSSSVYIYKVSSIIPDDKENKSTPLYGVQVEYPSCQVHRSCEFLDPTNRNLMCFSKYPGPIQRPWIWTLPPRKERTHIPASVCF